MKRNNKKGFTIVELVIVIAVIAILAAVMIPTFGGIIKKANNSAVQQAAAALYKQAIAIDLADGVQDGSEGPIVMVTEGEGDDEVTYNKNAIKVIEGKNVTYTVTTDEAGKISVTFSYKDNAKNLTATTTDGSNWTVQ